jgi:hypothetical protein
MKFKDLTDFQRRIVYDFSSSSVDPMPEDSYIVCSVRQDPSLYGRWFTLFIKFWGIDSFGSPHKIVSTAVLNLPHTEWLYCSRLIQNASQLDLPERGVIVESFLRLAEARKWDELHDPDL